MEITKRDSLGNVPTDMPGDSYLEHCGATWWDPAETGGRGWYLKGRDFSSGKMDHAYNPRVLELGEKDYLGVSGQPGLQSETLP